MPLDFSSSDEGGLKFTVPRSEPLVPMSSERLFLPKLPPVSITIPWSNFHDGQLEKIAEACHEEIDRRARNHRRWPDQQDPTFYVSKETPDAR